MTDNLLRIPFSDLARKATTFAVYHSLHHPPLAREDYEDMNQEAEITLWRLRDRHENYAFKDAKGTVRTFFWRYVLEISRKDGIPADVIPPQEVKCHLPEGEFGDILIAEDEIVQDDDGPTTKLTPEIISFVEQHLIATHQWCRPGSKSLQRHIEVLKLVVCAGLHSNDAIALELGLTRETVRNYHSNIRRALRKALTHQVLTQLEQSL